MQSHFYLDEFPQSTEPLDENPRPHTQLGAQLEDDYVSADDGYEGRPFPQMRRPSFLGPGPDTDSEGPDEALGAGGALLAGRSEAGTQTEPPWGSGVAAAAGGALEGVRAGASAFPAARNIGRAGGAAVGGLGAAALGLGMGAVGGAYQGARYMLGGGSGGDAASSSSSEFQDIRTLNGMQQGAPQERISLQQPRVQQPMVSRLNSSEDDAPMTQQQAQPRPQVRSRPAPQPKMPFGLNQVAQPSSGSDSYGPVRRPRPQRAEPSFNELRREALAREPEAA